MKITDYVIKPLLAFGLVLLFTQCKDQEKPKTEDIKSEPRAVSAGRLPIAYINQDSLLLKYNFAKDLNETMLRRVENARANLTEKSRQLEKEYAEFQRKLQNNAFLSQDRAEQEQQRLMKKQQDLQQLAQRLDQENMMEQQKMAIQMNDSVINFIKEYNKTKKYEMIFNNSSLLYVNPEYDITNEVVTLLNKRYNPKK